jgi:ABC-type sugar transport system substrate-binding protein
VCGIGNLGLAQRHAEVRKGIDLKQSEYGIQEVKKEGIEVEYLWDPPSQADVDEESRKIEYAISRQPDGLCVAALDPARNGQLLDQALEAKIKVLTFNAYAGPKYPFVGRHDDAADGYDLAKYLVEKMGGRVRWPFCREARRLRSTWAASKDSKKR